VEVARQELIFIFNNIPGIIEQRHISQLIHDFLRVNNVKVFLECDYITRFQSQYLSEKVSTSKAVKLFSESFESKKNISSLA
jgi:hypothetical protein